MPSPYLSEDQCSSEFYSQVRRSFGILPIRTHGTRIEALEGTDVIYVVKSAMKRNVKALLVQEKAPYPPPFRFVLKKHQHNTLLNRQNTFRYRAYFYAFFCVKHLLQLQNITGRTVHFDVDKIPAFNSNTRRVRATASPFYVYPNHRRRRGYHLIEILLRLSYCWMGLPKKFFPQLIEDLRRLVEENERFYVAIYDKDEREVSIFLSLPRPERKYNEE